MGHSNKTFWLKEIKVTRMKLNASVWLSSFLSHFFFICAALSVFIFFTKRFGIEIISDVEFLSLCFLFSILISIFRARKGFFSFSETSDWLDEKLCLYNQLGCANKGIGEWPAQKVSKQPLTRWNWQKILLPSLSGLMVVMLTAWMPVHKISHAEDFIKEAPLNWQEAKEWLDELKEEEIIAEESLEESREQLNQLINTPPEEWFNHDNLEAGDTLHSQLENTLKEMFNSLENAKESIEQLTSNPQNLSKMENKALAQQFKEALKNLGQGMLPLNNELLQKLKNIDPKNLKELTPEQLKKIMKKIKEAKGACKKCVGEGKKETLVIMEGRPKGNRLGKGAITRGPGAAPMWLNENASPSSSRHREDVKNDNLDHISFDKNVGQSMGEHQIDKSSYNKNLNSGSTKNKGKGGEAVWRDNFLPAEKKILEKYFK